VQDDIVMAAPNANNSVGMYQAGQAYILFGRRGIYGANVTMAYLDGKNGFVAEGPKAGYRLGAGALGYIGDWNGDGIGRLALCVYVCDWL
jgi:hypothetical protein